MALSQKRSDKMNLSGIFLYLLLFSVPSIWAQELSFPKNADVKNLSANHNFSVRSHSIKQWQEENDLIFIENKGQIIDSEGNLRPDIAYVSDAGGVKLYFMENSVSYVITDRSRNIEKSRAKQMLMPHELTDKGDERGVPIKVDRVDLELIGSSSQMKLLVDKQIDGYFNYYYGYCPQGITEVRAYKKLMYENVYDNIDLVFYGDEIGVKCDFLLNPGGKLSDIQLRFVGPEQMNLTVEGTVRILNSSGEVRKEEPFYIQINSPDIIDQTNNLVENIFKLEDYILSSNVDDYNISKRMIVTSPNVLWATYYGGTNGDYGRSITTDGDGNVLIVGYTYSMNFPVNTGQTSFADSTDAFVLKFNGSGTRIWSTYYGGSDYDIGRGVATDASGNVVITGNTSSDDFPVSSGAFQSSHPGGRDAFIVKFNSNGTRLWSTYYGGGEDWDYGLVIATDGSGNVLISGKAWSSDFPVSSGAFQTSYAGNGDAFVVKFNSNGTRLWATYYGGSDEETGWGITTDASGNVWISGHTFSTDFPVSSGAFQTRNAGDWDAFVVKFNSSGARLWSTYYGGTGEDKSWRIAGDGSGNVAITGETAGTDFPISSGAFQTSNAGDWDIFVVKFNSNGTRLWATYYGGSDTDYGFGIAMDESGNVAITNYTNSTDFPVTSEAVQTSNNGGWDTYVVIFNSDGDQLWATYYGGSDNDYCLGITTDNNGNILITGSTYSTDFPVTSGAFQTDNAGSADVFVVKFIIITYPTTLTLNTTISFPYHENPSDYDPTDYRIIGLPGDGRSLLENLLPGTAGEDWQVYWDNGAPSDYLIEYDGGLKFRFSVGRAFWLINKGPWSVNTTVSSAPLNESGAVEIPLHPGWNLITNPFTRIIPWSTIQNINRISRPIYSYNRSFNTPQNFSPYVGYYYFNEENLSFLSIPYVGGLTKALASDSHDDVWKVNISLSTGDFFEQTTWFGVASDASRGKDRFDYRKPKAVGFTPGVYFKRPQWDMDYSIFATDIRPEFSESETWEFSVHGIPFALCELLFENIDQIPLEFEVYLIDKERSTFINLRKHPYYSFTSTDKESNFIVIVGKESVIDEQLASVLPKEFILGNNFPNPFNALTTIPVDVPFRSDITLNIYDLIGQEVTTLYAGSLEAQRHFFVWDGKDNHGRKISTGIYFYRIIARKDGKIKFQDTKKLILLK